MSLTKVLLLFMAALALSACTFFKLIRSSKLKQPTFAYVSYQVKEVDESKATIAFTVDSYNPNAIGLKNVTLGYELFSEGKRFLQGDGIQVELKPKDTTRIVVPAVIVYQEVFRAVGPAAEKILLNKKSMPVRIDAVMTGKPTVYNEMEEGSLFHFTLKLSRTVDVPLTGVEAQLKKTVKGFLKKVF
jgi:hypothetical protein